MVRLPYYLYVIIVVQVNIFKFYHMTSICYYMLNNVATYSSNFSSVGSVYNDKDLHINLSLFFKRYN